MGIIFDSLKTVVKKITKLSRPYFALEENQIKFKIDSEIFYNYPIENIEIKTRHDSYVIDAYTLNSDELYIEYIQTDHDVTWNGLALPYFINLLKTNLRIKDMQQLEKKEFNHYEFYTYKVDEEYILNIIHIYEVDKEIFIVDKKANLYEDLLKNFEKNYNYKYEKNMDISMYMNFSLVRNNAMNSYFSLSSQG